MHELVTAPMRQVSALKEREHRPWPLPRRPWVMGQSWRSLLFAHWSLDAADVEPFVPAPLEVDTFDGRAWVGITPFILTGFRLALAPPLPYLSTFPEVNVRTYASYGGKPGIYFFSLDAQRRLAVEGARRFYRLPYFVAEMTAERCGDLIEYASRRVDERGHRARLALTYEAEGGVDKPKPGSVEYFLTERYCLYTVDPEDGVLRADIHHPPWRLQNAKAEIAVNSMPPQGLELPDTEPVLHYSDLQDVLVWSPQRV